MVAICCRGAAFRGDARSQGEPPVSDEVGADREYVSHQLRRTFREGGKVTHETLANLSALPIAAIEAVRAVLAGKTVAVAGEALTLIRNCRTGTRPRSGPRPRRWA